MISLLEIILDDDTTAKISKVYWLRFESGVFIFKDMEDDSVMAIPLAHIVSVSYYEDD